MKILLVDDHILFREGLASLLETQSGLTVTGFADSVKDAVHQTNTLSPELVLMDFHLPDGNGLDYIRQIRKPYPQLKVVFLTTSDDDISLLETDSSSAVGYLRKNTPVSDLLSFIHDLKHSETTYSRSG